MNNKKKIMVNGEIFINYPDKSSSIYVSSSDKNHQKLGRIYQKKHFINDYTFFIEG